MRLDQDPRLNDLTWSPDPPKRTGWCWIRRVSPEPFGTDLPDAFAVHLRNHAAVREQAKVWTPEWETTNARFCPDPMAHCGAAVVAFEGRR